MDHKGEPPHAEASGGPDVVGDSQHMAEEARDHQSAPKASPLPWQSGSVDVSEPGRACWPTQARRVSFADTFGLSLVSIKEFDARGASTLPDLEVDSKQQVEYWLSCLFPTPSSEAELVGKLAESKVELESVGLLPGTTTLKGNIRVLNFCFDKRVYVRATLDGWASHSDLLAEFVPGPSDGQTDRFSFRLTLVPQFGPDGTRVEFCLRYETAAGTFWANNGGSNYVLFCVEGGASQGKGDLQKTRRSCLKGVGREPAAGTGFSMGACSSLRACSPVGTCSSSDALGEHNRSSEAIARKGPEARPLEEKTGEDHEKPVEHNGPSKRRRQRWESHLDQIRNHFAQREAPAGSGGGETARGEGAMAGGGLCCKSSPPLSGGTEDGHQASSQGLGPPCEPDSPSPPAKESVVNQGTNGVSSRTNPEAGLGKTEEEGTIPGLAQVILEMKDSDLCEAIPDAKSVHMTESQHGALSGPASFEASFISQSGAGPAVPQEVTSLGAQGASEQATNMQGLTETGSKSDISRKPSVQHAKATHGKVSLVRTEPKPDSQPPATQHPFAFGIFVAPLYQQASRRMTTDGRGISGEPEAEPAGDFNWWEDMETDEEDESSDAGSQSDTSAGVPAVPAEQSESWHEKFLVASVGHENVLISAAKDRESITDRTQNTTTSLQTQTFLDLECREDHRTPDDGPSTESGDSYDRLADEAVTNGGRAEADSLVRLQKLPNISLGMRALVEKCGPDMFIASSNERSENTRKLPEARDTAISDLYSKNEIDVCLGENVLSVNEDSNGVNDEESVGRDGEDGRSDSGEQSKGHKVCGKLEESLNDLKGAVSTDTVEQNGNEEELVKSKEAALIEQKEETSLREAKKAFSEDVGVIAGVRDGPGGDKVLISDAEDFLMEVKDRHNEGGNIFLKNSEAGGREANNDDIFRKRINEVAEMFCAGKENDVTGQDGCFRDEEMCLNMPKRNEKGDQRDTSRGASHLPECEEAIYSVNIEYIYERDTGLRKEGDVFTEEKVRPCEGGGGREDVCEGEIFGEGYVKKMDQEKEFYFSEEDGISYARRCEDCNAGLMEGKGYLDRKEQDEQEGRGDLSEQNSILLPEGERTFYGTRGEDMLNVRGKEHLQEEDREVGEARRALHEAESTSCEEGRVGHVDAGDREFDEEVGSVGAGEEHLQSEMDPCTDEADVEVSTSGGSCGDDEMEQYMLGLKCHEKSPNPTTFPHRDALTLVDKKNLISQGVTVRTPLPSIRESPYEGWAGDEGRQGSWPSTDLAVARESRNINHVRLPPVEDGGKATRIHPFCKNDASSFEDASKVVIGGMSAALLLMTAYHYDFIVCLMLYLFSLFWLCCHVEKDQFTSE